MSRFNSPFLAIIVLIGFLLLAHYSLEQEPVGYDHSVFDVLSLTQRQAAALKDLWGITDAELDAPVNLFGE